MAVVLFVPPLDTVLRNRHTGEYPGYSGAV